MSIPQIYAAGIFDSDVAYRAGVKITKPRNVYYYELEFYLEDCGIAYINDEEYEIKKNTVLLSKPNDLRHSLLPMKSHYIRFYTDDEYLLSIISSIPTVFSSARVEEYVKSVRRLISYQSEEKRTREARLCAEFLSLISEIYDECRIISRLHGDTARQNSLAVTKAKVYIEENYPSECSLAEIAAHVSFSPVYFHKLFKSATKKTPYQYLNEVRIKHAKEFILTGEVPLSEVGEKCGFSSQQYFNYAFKKEVGITPTQYKISMQEKYIPKE